MGNTLILPCGRPVRGDQIPPLESAVLPSQKNLNGDSCLTHIVRSCTSGASAKQRLEATCAARQLQWKLQSQQQAGKAAGWRTGSLQATDPALLLRRMLDAQNNKGETALSVAAQLGQAEAVQFLLEQGANPWLSDRLGGRTALHTACLNGHHLVVKVLLEQLPSQWLTNPSGARGRYVNCMTVSGFTPLHCAACSGDGPTIKAVLAHHPALLAHNAHMSWEYGMDFPIDTTAMHVAASKGNMRIVKELLRHYVRHHQRALPDPRLARNSQGELPWQVAYNVHHACPLVDMLHPSVPLAMLFSEPDNSLQALASAALQKHLLHGLDTAQQLQQACAPQQCAAECDGIAVLKVPQQLPSPDGSHSHKGYTLDVPRASRSSTSSTLDVPYASSSTSLHLPDVTPPPSSHLPYAGPSTAGSSCQVSRGDLWLGLASSDSDCKASGCGRDTHGIMGMVVADLHMGEVEASMLAESRQLQQGCLPAGPRASRAAGWFSQMGCAAGADRPLAVGPLMLTLGRVPDLKGSKGAQEDLLRSLTVPEQVANQPIRPQQTTAPAAASEASSPHSSSIEEEVDDGGEYGGLLSREMALCNICMDMEARMELAPCTHRLCEGCARHMVQNMKTKPVDCPFCRRHITGFVVAV